jgi:hypothetical protein
MQVTVVFTFARRIGLVLSKLKGSCFGKDVAKFIFSCSANVSSLRFLSSEAVLLFALQLLFQQVDNKELIELFC